VGIRTWLSFSIVIMPDAGGDQQVNVYEVACVILLFSSGRGPNS